MMQTKSLLIPPLAELLKKNCGSSDTFVQPRIPWKFIFPQAVWQIWLHRNNFIFKTGRINDSIHVQCIKKGVEFYAIIPGNTIKPPRTQIQVNWTKPNPSWVKLNTDGAIFGEPKKPSGGRCCNVVMEIGLLALLKSLAQCLVPWRSSGPLRMAWPWPSN